MAQPRIFTRIHDFGLGVILGHLVVPLLLTHAAPIFTFILLCLLCGQVVRELCRPTGSPRILAGRAALPCSAAAENEEWIAGKILILACLAPVLVLLVLANDRVPVLAVILGFIIESIDFNCMVFMALGDDGDDDDSEEEDFIDDAASEYQDAIQEENVDAGLSEENDSSRGETAYHSAESESSGDESFRTVTEDKEEEYGKDEARKNDNSGWYSDEDFAVISSEEES